MKRTRDRSGRARPAPAPNVSFGGLAVSGGANQTASVGQAGAGGTARRPKVNTMAKSRDGGMPITYYAPMERWVGTTARTASDAPKAQPTPITKPSPKGRAATGDNAVGEGIRQVAMARASVLRNTGAVDIRVHPKLTPATAPAYLQTGQTGPVWSQETNECDHARYGEARDAF